MNKAATASEARDVSIVRAAVRLTCALHPGRLAELALGIGLYLIEVNIVKKLLHRGTRVDRHRMTGIGLKSC